MPLVLCLCVSVWMCSVKALCVEVEQGSRWDEHTYALDELRPHNSLKLYRPLPDLSHPLLDGHIHLLRPPTPGVAPWVRVYAAVKGAALYVFQDDTRTRLLGVLDLCTIPPLPPTTDSDAAPPPNPKPRRAVIRQVSAATHGTDPDVLVQCLILCLCLCALCLACWCGGGGGGAGPHVGHPPEPTAHVRRPQRPHPRTGRHH